MRISRLLNQSLSSEHHHQLRYNIIKTTEEVMTMRMVDVIEKKRDGHALSAEEIEFFVQGYSKGDIPDYQASALAMTIFFQDMNDEERGELTRQMVLSGQEIDLSEIDGIKVDKHSTGGVGDTTTLVLAPLVASVGVPVAKMSGRGLGHTGGTLDKLESFEGFNIELDQQSFIDCVNRDKVAVIGQSGDLTPADKKLYALRDVTATVNSIPLIASSIMSKKIASGAERIVLDVKVGKGAFMKDIESATELAKAMVSIGQHIGRTTEAVISDMNQPLGYAIGNALEVKEAIDTLTGNGPEDLTELVLELGSRMVVLGEKASTIEEAREMLIEAIESKKALETFKTFIKNQGGNPSQVDNPTTLPTAQYQIDVPAESSGYITELIANELGVASMHLGAGRATKDDVIDLAVGIVLHKKIGDQVEAGESIATIHANQQDVESVKQKVLNAIEINDERIEYSLIHKVITGKDVTQ